MKSTDRIPLNTTIQVASPDGKGAVVVNESRSVKEEIARLRHLGALEAADRLESTCDDTFKDTGDYVEPKFDPTLTGEERLAASAPTTKTVRR